MGLLSCMWSVIDWNVIMQHMTEYERSPMVSFDGMLFGRGVCGLTWAMKCSERWCTAYLRFKFWIRRRLVCVITFFGFACSGWWWNIIWSWWYHHKCGNGELFHEWLSSLNLIFPAYHVWSFRLISHCMVSAVQISV